MLMCNDCKSTNIVEVDRYFCYFREGDWLRQRSILVCGIEDSYTALCPELDAKTVGVGTTHLLAIESLGELLKTSCHVKMLGSKIEE